MSDYVEPLTANVASPKTSPEIYKADSWLKREQRLLNHVDANVKWMIREADKSRIIHKYLSFVILSLAIIAPLFAVTSTQRIAYFGLPDGWLPIVSAVVTLLLSLAEGARRIGRYDDIWRTMDLALLELRSAREIFRDAKVEHQLGSPERIAALKKFRKETERVVAMAVLAAHNTSKGNV